MGQQQSDAAEEKAVGGRSRYAVLHRQLYRNLTAPDPTGAPVDDNTFKVNSLHMKCFNVS